jgi:hypothetical protein
MTESTDTYPGDGDRLSRVEALVAANAQSIADIAKRQQKHDETLARVEKITESNARSIAANTSAISGNARSITELRVGIEVLGELLRTVFSELMDRLEAIESRLDGNGGNGNSEQP